MLKWCGGGSVKSFLNRPDFIQQSHNHRLTVCNFLTRLLWKNKHCYIFHFGDSHECLFMFNLQEEPLPPPPPPRGFYIHGDVGKTHYLQVVTHYLSPLDFSTQGLPLLDSFSVCHFLKYHASSHFYHIYHNHSFLL